MFIKRRGQPTWLPKRGSMVMEFNWLPSITDNQQGFCAVSDVQSDHGIQTTPRVCLRIIACKKGPIHKVLADLAWKDVESKKVSSWRYCKNMMVVKFYIKFCKLGLNGRYQQWVIQQNRVKNAIDINVLRCKQMDSLYICIFALHINPP